MPRIPARLKKAFADTYPIERQIGRGGMATVYLARDVKHDRDVAVKVLHPELAASLGTDRFLSEIKIAAKLSHPHILPLHDSGKAGSFLYYIMPYVDGGSLAERIRNEVQLPIDQTIQITEALADGLNYAHGQGVIHRDIKPENIMFNGGKPTLADFGIALAVTSAENKRLTETGMSIGTPAYMSPEQASGDPHLNERSDLYSLACVVYEMLTGQPPFLGTNPQAIMARHVTDAVPPIATVRPTVGDGIAHVVTRALAKVPADRFVTVSEFAEALVAAESQRDLTATKSIAVLPFANLSRDADAELFGDGLTAEIITDLSKIHALRVISQTSAMQFKGANKDLRTIGRELNVRYVLEGSVRGGSDTLRVTTQLVDASSETPVWAEQYNSTGEDVLDIQARVSSAIIKTLKLKRDTGEEEVTRSPSIPNLHAHECYLRARNDIWRFTEPAVIHALQYLQEALDIVGENVLLYAAIAEAYYLFPQIAGNEPEACLERVEDCANRMLDLDPNSPLGYGILGLVRWKQVGGAQEGAKHLVRAFELSPADPSILLWLGFYAAEAGQLTVAERCVNKLVEVDPLSPLSHRNVGWLHLMSGRERAALEAYKKAYEAESDRPNLRFLYAYCLARNGESDKTSGIIDRMVKDTASNVWTWIGKFYVAALQGDKKKALRVVTADLKQAARWSEQYSFHMSECYALIGEEAQAMEWLENAVRRGFINYPFLAESAPYLDNVRDDTRFGQLLAKAKRHWTRFEM